MNDYRHCARSEWKKQMGNTRGEKEGKNPKAGWRDRQEK